MTSALYRLAPSVHWCRVHGFSIILDAKNDKYMSVPARQFDALLPYFEEISTASVPARDICDMPADIASLIDELFAKGILVSTATDSTRRVPQRVPCPQQLVSTASGMTPFRRALRYAPIFLQACITADRYLRLNPFPQTVSRVAARKHINDAAPRHKLVHLTHAFHALRPLYPRSYLCLFDSLALLEFLAYWHLAPSWVFGVTVDPFEAHCWVQEDTLVLCDTRSFQCRWFTQIMVV